VGVLAAGAMSAGEAIGYIVSQFVGGVAGALLLKDRSGWCRPRASACLHWRTTSL